MTSLQTFPLFPILPPEIRRRIWGYAHNVYAPRAYFVCVNLDPMEAAYLDPPNTIYRMTIHHVHAESIRFRPYPDPLQTLGNTWALKRACHESRSEVAQGWKTFKPERIMDMGLRNGDVEIFKFAPYEIRGARYPMSAVIDGANDLVIVESWFVSGSQLSHATAVAGLEIPERGQISRYFGLCALRQIAVPHEGIIPVTWYGYQLKRLKAAFPELRILYIYLMPGMLVNNRDDQIPKGYLAAGKRAGRKAPASFRTRDRIFYELDLAKMKVAPGAIPAIFASFARKRSWRTYETRANVTIKFLSWMWIN